jgi:hypothetical protein
MVTPGARICGTHPWMGCAATYRRARSRVKAARSVFSGGYAFAAASRKLASMRIVVTSNDPVRLSFLMALLRDAGIGCVLLDAHVSAMEGSIGAIPRRLAVADDDGAQATRVLREAGEA